MAITFHNVHDMTGTRLFRKGCQTLIMALLMLLIVHVGGLSAHMEPDHRGQGAEEASPGVEEHVGAKIPPGAVFRDEAGKPVRLGELITVPTIIVPVYFGCTNVCYNVQWALAQVLPKIRNRPGVEYRVISVSFDEHDTPELAAKFKQVYLNSMPAAFPPDGWRFLTGDVAAIKLLTDSIGFAFQRRGHDFLHPVVSVIVSGDGTVVRYLHGSTFLPKDLTLALVEARHGRGGTAIRKVVEYCFSYDPEQKTYVFNLLRVCASVVILSAGGFLAFLILTGRKRGQLSSRK